MGLREGDIYIRKGSAVDPVGTKSGWEESLGGSALICTNVPTWFKVYDFMKTFDTSQKKNKTITIENVTHSPLQTTHFMKMQPFLEYVGGNEGEMIGGGGTYLPRRHT